MSITIELSPEVEARLRLLAERRQLSLEEFVTRTLSETALAVARDERTPEERLAAFREATEHFKALNLPPLPAEAFERASFYEDDWEILGRNGSE
jgi:uncharacterized protein (DUF1778 family)